MGRWEEKDQKDRAKDEERKSKAEDQKYILCKREQSGIEIERVMKANEYDHKEENES